MGTLFVCISFRGGGERDCACEARFLQKLGDLSPCYGWPLKNVINCKLLETQIIPWCCECFVTGFGATQVDLIIYMTILGGGALPSPTNTLVAICMTDQGSSGFDGASSPTASSPTNNSDASKVPIHREFSGVERAPSPTQKSAGQIDLQKSPIAHKYVMYCKWLEESLTTN